MTANFIAPVLCAVAASPIDVSHFIGDRDGLSYDIAHFIMKIVDWILGIFGLDHNVTMVTFLYAAVVLCIAIVVGYVVQWLVLRAVQTVARHWDSDTYNAMRQQRFFH